MYLNDMLNISSWVNILLILLLFLPIFLVLFETSFRIIFLVVAEFSGKSSQPPLGNEIDENISIIFLMLAHNEERVLSQTLGLVKAQVDVGNARLVVVADNCTDRTIEVSHRAGVMVSVRSDGIPGKAHALSWFVEHNIGIISEYDLIVIIDADTQLSNDFCTAIRNVFQSQPICVAQSSVEPINEQGMVVTTLAAFSEILSQRVDDYARSVLGWSVPLRGTGMVFKRDVFLQVCSGLRTQVDDIELTIRLTCLGIPVHFVSDAIVYDPKSQNILGLAKQRGRWLKGQRQIFSNMKYDLTKILLSGISGCSLIQSLLIKPKTLLIVIKIMLIILLLFIASFPYWEFLEIILVVSVLVDLAYYCMGLRYVADHRIYASALLMAPLYLILWLAGWFFSFISGQHWLRSRD